MSFDQRLLNLGIDPELPEEEIKRLLAELSEKHGEEETEELEALTMKLRSSKSA